MREVEPGIWMALVLTQGTSRTRSIRRPFPTDLVSEASLQAMLQQWWDAFRVCHGPALTLLSPASEGFEEPKQRGADGAEPDPVAVGTAPESIPPHALLGTLWKRRRKLRTKANRHLRLALASGALDREGAGAAAGGHRRGSSSASYSGGAGRRPTPTLLCARLALAQVPPRDDPPPRDSPSTSPSHSRSPSPSGPGLSPGGGSSPGLSHLLKLGKCLRDLDVASREALGAYRSAPQCRLRALLRSVLDLALYYSDVGRVTPVNAFDGQVAAAMTPEALRHVQRFCERLEDGGDGVVGRVAVYYDGKVARQPSRVASESATVGRLLRWHAAQALTPLAPPEEPCPAWMQTEASRVSSAARPPPGDETELSAVSTWRRIDASGLPREFSYVALGASGESAGACADASVLHSEPSFTTSFFRATTAYHSDGLFLYDPGVPDALEAWALAYQWGESCVAKMRPRGAPASVVSGEGGGSGMWEGHIRHLSEGAESSVSAAAGGGAIVDAVSRSSAAGEGKSTASPRSRTGSTSSSPEMMERYLFLNGTKPAAGSVPAFASGFLALGRMLQSVPMLERRRTSQSMSVGLWCVPHDWPGLASIRDSPALRLRDSVVAVGTGTGDRRPSAERWGIFCPSLFLHHPPFGAPVAGTAAQSAEKGLKDFALHCERHRSPSHRLALLQVGRMTIAVLLNARSGDCGSFLPSLCESIVGGSHYRDFVSAYDSLARAQELARQLLQHETGIRLNWYHGSVELMGLLGPGPCPALAPTMARYPLPIGRAVTAYDMARQGEAFSKWQRSDRLLGQLSRYALAVLTRCVDHMQHRNDHVGADLVDAMWAHYHEVAAVFTGKEGVPPTAVLEMVANRRPAVSRQPKSTSNFMSVETIANYSSIREFKKAQENLAKRVGRARRAGLDSTSRWGGRGGMPRDPVKAQGSEPQGSHRGEGACARVEASHTVLAAVESVEGKSVLLVEARRRPATDLVNRARVLVRDVQT